MKKFLLLGLSIFLSTAVLFAQTAKELDSVKTKDVTKDEKEAEGLLQRAEEIKGSKVQMAMSNANYLVTPGDVYTLSFVAGTNAMEYKAVVDSSYKIRVANLAVIDASGKTYLALKKQVEDLVARNYPMSGVQFILTVPSEFEVLIMGEVKNIKEVSAWSLSRLDSVITGNTTDYTSIRNITIKSADGKVKSYDLLRALRFGEMDQNPYLRPGDSVILNKLDRQITISGAVKRPGKYELKPGENLKELVEYYADGLQDQADTSQIEISRITGATTRTGDNNYLTWDEALSYELKNFDQIYIKTVADMRPVMYIEGAVLKSASVQGQEELEGATKLTVQFYKDTNYGFFIKVHKNYFETPLADLSNSYVYRNGQVIPLDISKILYDPDFSTDLKVEPNDVLTVPMRQFFVSVAGSVSNPNRYPYIPNKTYEYYIGLAGGFNKSQNKGKAVEIRDADGNKLNKTQVITPESTITAETNSFLYYFNQYAPVITTILSIISTTISLYLYSRQL